MSSLNINTKLAEENRKKYYAKYKSGGNNNELAEENRKKYYAKYKSGGNNNELAEENRKKYFANYKLNNIIDKVQGLYNDYNKNISEVSKFDSDKWNKKQDVDNQLTYYTDIKTRQEELKSEIKRYKSSIIDNLGENKYNKLLKSIKSIGKKTNKTTNFLSVSSKYYSEFKDEKDFNEKKANEKETQKMLGEDTAVLEEQIENLENLEADVDKRYETFTFERTVLQTELSYVIEDLGKYRGYEHKKEEFEEASEKYTEIVEALDNLFEDYSDIIDENGHRKRSYVAEITEKERYLNKVKLTKEYNKLYTDAVEDSEFDKIAGNYKTTFSDTDKNNPETLNVYYWFRKIMRPETDLLYEYINGSDTLRGQIYKYYMKDALAVGTGDASAEDLGEVSEVIFEGTKIDKRHIDEMNADEIKIFNYYFNKGERDKAYRYLDFIQEGLNKRYSDNEFKKYKGDTASELFYGIKSGLDSFKTSTENLLSDKDFYPTSSTQMTAEAIKEDLKDVGYKTPDWMGGQSLGQIGFDAISTASNMMPSVLTSTVVGMVNPVAGKVAGVALMGASAAGNAYSEMINLGYNKSQARTYATLVGASEAGLSYLLGGIGKLGGKLSSKIAGKLASKFDKALGKFAINYGSSIVSEGLEEYAQSVLEPVFKNLTLHTDEKIDLLAPEHIYSSLLGGITGSFFGISESYSKARRANADNRNSTSWIIAKAAILNGDYQKIVDNANAYGIDTEKFNRAMSGIERFEVMLSQNMAEESDYDYYVESAAEELISLSADVHQKNKNPTEFNKLISNTKTTHENQNTALSKKGINNVDGFLEQSNDIKSLNESVVKNVESGSAINDGEVVLNKFKNDNKSARVGEIAKNETAKNDLLEHIDDENYAKVYNELVNIDEVTSAGPMEAVRRSKEFNRIYEMGIEEEVLPHNIKSDIFTPEQVRRIYTAAVVDDNHGNYDGTADFDEVLNEYETKATLSIFGDETVKNIMTASAEQVRAVGEKLGVNVVFGDTVPGDDPNAPGAYDPDTNTIYINKNTKYPMQQIFLHELTHFFEKAENYLEFQKSVFNSKAFKKWLKRKTQIKDFKSFNSLEEYREEISKRYDRKDPDEIDREIVAFFVSDNLFQKDFGDIGRLATELKGSEKEKFISFMKNIFNKFKNAITGINKLEKKFLKLYDSAMQNKNTDNNGGVKQMKEVDVERGSTIDLYTEKQYNDYGWVRANDVLTPAEYEHFKNSLSDHKNLGFKFTKNPITKETIIPTGDNTNLLNVLIYTKGTFKNPVITKVVRVNSNDPTDVAIIRSEILDNESRGGKNTLENVEDVYGQQYFVSVKKQDMPTFQEHKREQEGNVGRKSFKNTELDNGRTKNRTKNNGIEAELNDSAFSIGEKSHKQQQFDIILKNNPANDDYHTWIRNEDDILTFEEALKDSSYEGWEENGFNPDYDGNIAKQALQSGKITVYSSYPIKQGVFVTPSKMEAESYSGTGKVYEKTVLLTDVAWIDPTQGQYAKVDNSKIQNMLSGEDTDINGFVLEENEDGEISYYNPDELQRQLRKKPKSAVLDRRQIELKAKDLIKQHQSRINSKDVAEQLSVIYNSIKNIDEQGNHAKPKVDKLANEIFDNIVEKSAPGEMYEELKDFFRNNPIVYSESLKEDFSSDWADFIRRNRARLNLVKESSGKRGSGIDEVYDTLCREFPGYFSDRHDGEKEQLEEMARVINALETPYDTFTKDNKDEIIKQIVSDIYSGFFDVDFIDKKSDEGKAQKDYKFSDSYFDDDGNGIDEKQFKRSQRVQINQQSADYVKELKALYKSGKISAEQFADRLTSHFSRVSLSAKIKPIETYYKESFKYRERYKIINEKITKNIKELRSMLERPTEGKYIPQDLIELVEEVLKIGDNQNFDLADKMKRYRDALKQVNSEEFDESAIKAYEQALEAMESDYNKQNKLGAVFAQISSKYNSYKDGNGNNFEQSFYCYHEAVAGKLQEVATILDKADMTRLNMRQAEALSEGLNCLTYFVKNSIKADEIQKGATVYETAQTMVDEISKAGGFDTFLDKAVLPLLNPERFFNALSGWKYDSACSKVGRMLNDGQTVSLEVKARLNKAIAGVLDGENFKKAQATQKYGKDDLVDIGLVDGNGNTIKVPKSFAISAFMHLQNEQNQNHALKGGFKIPDFRKYHKTSVTEGFENGKRVWFKDIYKSISLIQNVLDDYDRLVIKTVKDLFNKHTKAEYNKTTLEVFGFKKARVNNYFPLYTDKNFTQSDFTAVFDVTLKNQGNMQERKNASNPIMLMDVFDIVGKEIERCGEYCGKLKAEIMFKRIYNTVMKDFETSVKEQISDKGKKYIENFMQDYSGTRATENSPRLNRLRSNVATSALLLNINVAFKQTSSYPSAAAIIGFKPLLKAFAADGDGRFVLYRANKDLIDKYSSYYKIRREGYSSQETVDLRNNSFYEKRALKWLFGWITAVDTAVVGRLWYAAEYYVQDNNTDLKKGTDEYYKEVGKIFDRIVLETQDNYTVMQRPDVLRNPNSIIKSMVMFMTQPLQQFGTLYESTGNLLAQQRAYKAGEIDESVLKEAQKREARAITSVVISIAMCSAMAFLAKALKGALDDYLDKYGEFSLSSAAKGIGNDMLNNIFGMVPFGSTVYQTVLSMVTGENYYGLSVANIDLINDALDSAVSYGQLLFSGDITWEKFSTQNKNTLLKVCSLFGIPARNATKLVEGFTNLIQYGDYFAIDGKKKDSQYYVQMYDCIISGDSKKYNELYEQLLDKGITVNEVESGIKKCLKEAESKDIKEAAEALNAEDFNIYDEIVNDLIKRGFDEKLVLSAIDDVANSMKSDELTNVQKIKYEKSKRIYMTDLLKGINIDGLSRAEKAKAQEYAEYVAEEFSHEDVVGSVDNKTYAKAIEYDKKGRLPIEYFIIGKAITSTQFADTDGSGYVSNAEKAAAINKSKIPNDIKSLLRGLDII